MDSDCRYREFIALLKRRGQSVSSIARSMNSGREVQGRPVNGRAALNLVLLGLRSGKPTWERLRDVLTAKEYEVIRSYAAEKYARLLADGKVRRSGFTERDSAPAVADAPVPAGEVSP